MSIEATSAQTNFLEILFNDLGFTRGQRNAFVSREVGRAVGYLDELTVAEASALITALKLRKDEQAKPATGEEGA